MKKIILAAFVMLFSAGLLFAQQSSPAKPAGEKSTSAATAYTPDAKKKNHHKHTAHEKQSPAATSSATPAKKKGKTTKE